MSSTLALFSADTDRIKEYVFETAKLPEIRGASMILDDLNWGYDEEGQKIDPTFAKDTIGDVFKKHGLCVEQWPKGNLIYAGGGSLLALVPYDIAEQLKRDIEELYPRQTGAATITCVYRPVTEDELQHGLGGYTFEDLLALRDRLSPQEWKRIVDYYHDSGEGGDTITREQFARRKSLSELIVLQSIALRAGKEGKSIAPVIDALPYARRCDACEIRPAAEYVEIPEPRYLCQVCARKSGPSQRWLHKGRWIQRFGAYLRQHAEIATQYLRGCNFEGVEVAANLEEIALAAGGKAHGYIGFIYADGNGIGQQVESSQRLQEFQEKSKALATEIPKLVYAALAKHLKVQRDVKRQFDGERKVNVHPFEIITIGGDDLLLIVPADQAMPIVLTICQAFETSERLTSLFNKPTLSAGIVIAEHHTPIYFLRDLAEQLLRNAKKRAYELESTQSTVDFFVLKSQTTLATRLAHLRNVPPFLITDHQQKEQMHLTGRPYLSGDMERLMISAQSLAKCPHSQLQGYLRALQKGRFLSTVYFLYQYARADDHDRRILSTVFEQWEMMHDANSPPWLPGKPRRGYKQFWTPWADMLEIMDFVPQG